MLTKNDVKKLYSKASLWSSFSGTVKKRQTKILFKENFKEVYEIRKNQFENLIFSTKDPKSGAVVSRAHLLDSDFVNHKVNYYQGPLQEEASKLLKDFFKRKRL